MRSTIALVALAGLTGLALAACTPKKEEPAADAAATPAMPAGGSSAANAPAADPNAPPKDGEAQITVPPSANAGANITVTWTGPGNSGDYIDLVPRGYAQTTGEISYSYVRDSKGTVTLRAPTEAGDYDVRYVLDMVTPPRVVKVVAPLTVTASAATIQASATAEAGQELQVQWTGPNGPGDYVDLVKAGTTATSGEITYAYTSAGNPAKIEAPSAAGDYEIRYVLEGPGGRKVPAKSVLKVTTPKASLNAPATGEKGKPFKVEWTGPKSSGDYVDIVHKGTVATSGETDYFYVTQASPGELTAKDAGEYEIRYILEAPGGRAVLASKAISIR
jgi:Ca-activated chloride channel homolog